MVTTAMRKIEMVDLKKQYQKIKPDIDRAIQDVVDSSAFINGKPVQEFAAALAAYLGVSMSFRVRTERMPYRLR